MVGYERGGWGWRLRWWGKKDTREREESGDCRSLTGERS